MIHDHFKSLDHDDPLMKWLGSILNFLQWILKKKILVINFVFL